MDSDFTHLHVHTDASILDGLGTVSGLMHRVKSVGQTAVAMTDHGTLSNAIVFTVEANSAGIKPIIGMEGYVVHDGVVGHITLLADGNDGWRSLVNLNNLAQQSLTRQPAFTVDQLMNNSDNLLCLSGCISSPLQRLSEDEAVRFGSRLKSVFGSRLFSEIMTVDNSNSWERSIKLMERLMIKPVMTNDVHFAEKSFADVHPILTSIKAGFEYNSRQLWLRSASEMRQAGREHGLSDAIIFDAMQRATAIGKKIAPVVLKREPKLPKLPDDLGLRDLMKSFSTLYKEFPSYMDRVEYELRIIETMGFSDYFVILEDIVSWAKNSGIKVGPGRGSGVGSLILYLLGITEIDPIEHSLPFERFLNPERVGMPDVDVDFESERRDEVIDYANKKYDAIPIATYSRYSHKSLIRDLGKKFSIPKKTIDDLADEGPESKKFLRLREHSPELSAAYDAIIGQIRHKGKHAGGVIVTDQLVPMERVGGALVSGWTEGGQSELTYAGVVKYDLLGVSTLSTLARLERQFDRRPDPPRDDDPVFEIFRSGNVSGIFQFSGSDGIRRLTMDLKPNKFVDLVAINSLYRPGTIDAGVTEMYVDWKKKPRKVPEVFSDVLTDTYGAIVFQEQMMEVYRRAVGGTLGQADMARRLIANYSKHKDDPKYIEGIRKLGLDFVIGLTAQGLTHTEARQWWHEIETHSRYSFNRAHASAYSMIAWECAWWKYYHPAEFYAETLNTDMARHQQYVFEAAIYGIKIVPPHVNVSTDRWRTKDGKLYAPLSCVRQVGPSSLPLLLEKIEDGGPFTSVNDFMSRVPKSAIRANARLNLLLAGAFDGIKTLGKSKLEILEITKEKYEDAKKDDMHLFGFIIPDEEIIKRIMDYSERYDLVGVVSSRESRTSKYGPYTVYKLAPNGAFWSRDKEDKCDFAPGQIVALNTNSKTGRVRELVIL